MSAGTEASTGIAPDRNAEVIAALAKLEQSSRRVLPFGLIALLCLGGAIYLAGRELSALQTRVATADIELHSVIERAQAASESARQAELKIQQSQQELKKLTEEVGARKPAALPAANKASQDLISQLASVDRTLKEANLSARQAQIRPPVSAPRYGLMRVDVFYCGTGSDANFDRANRVFALREGNSNSRWRVRQLAPELNATPGYSIHNDVIRFNPDEKDIAERLQADIQKRIDRPIAMQQIAYPTPEYISVFLCTDK